MSDLPSLQTQFVQTIEAAKDLEALDKIRVRALGKKGEISALLSKLGAMAPEERKAYGQSVNQVKQAVQAALDTKRQSLDSEALAQKLASQTSDVTLPVRSHSFLDGRIHPISKVTEEIMEIFASLGFALAEGPDIETDSNNFTKLNIPPSHPARQDHDTFYLKADGDGNRPVLRTHTSPVQIRTMEAQDPPIRIIAPGRVYRSDSDQTHTPMFHQVEGLVIEEGIHMGHLKWTLEAFCKAFFEVDRVKMRFRASHFPFTEPSVEVDIGYEKRGSEIIIGEGDEWLEVLGCGMVHPNVLKNVGLDAEKLQGFAFGMGIDRLTMLKYGMPDLRPFFSADLEWLRHYGFGVLDIPTMQGGL